MAKRLEKKYKAALNPAPWVAPEEGNKAKDITKIIFKISVTHLIILRV